MPTGTPQPFETHAKILGITTQNADQPLTRDR